MWVGGYFQRICDQHREFGGGIFDDTEYRKSGHLRIEKCGTEEQRSLILRCPPFATKEVTFDLFTSVRVTWKGGGVGGAWGGVGSMGEGNVGDGQEAWQSYTDAPIGLRTYFIFSKYLS